MLGRSSFANGTCECAENVNVPLIVVLFSRCGRRFTATTLFVIDYQQLSLIAKWHVRSTGGMPKITRGPVRLDG
ncbi:hypothetical protein X777_09503 [Ooceraea biroi]|uniref:Uncharacterized protein n=1 Tax=Ooceraea biroi TaxID=2015173 RepID=A0A026W6K5_OOCBI|nr:hypothetical protein X777_09503 [Ooceraea biroi]